MTDEVVGLALTRFKAIQSKVALRASVLAEVAHQSGRTDAMSVVLPTSRLILALAVVLAIGSVFALGTCLGTLATCPSGRTITLARHIGTLSAMPAIALVRTTFAVPPLSARVLTRSPNITRRTFQRARNMVTLLGNILLHATLALAILSIESFWANLVAHVAQIPGRAMAFTGGLITRRVILAVTFLLAFRSKVSDGTL